MPMPAPHPPPHPTHLLFLALLLLQLPYSLASNPLPADKHTSLPSSRQSSANSTAVATPPPQVDIEDGMDPAFYRSYWTLDFLEKKWLNLSARFPSTIKHETIGKSVEGRKIIALRIGKTSSTAPRRVLLNSLLHANEWVSVMTTTYVAERLALDAQKDPSSDTAKLLSSVEVLLVPMCNPDGYAFTLNERNGIRYWRKNRRPSNCSKSPGVDLNRNWPIDFGGKHVTPLNDTCSYYYPGPEPFSEPETRALRDYVLANKGIHAHLDYNAYNQFVIGPYFHTKKNPPRSNEIDALGNRIADAMSDAAGETYRYSRAQLERLMSFASGIITDWTFSRGALAYHVAMRPDSDSTQGYDLPVTQLVDNGREGLAAAMVTIKFASEHDTTQPQQPSSGAVASNGSSTGDSGDRKGKGGDGEEPSNNRVAMISVGTTVGAAFVVIVASVAFIVTKRRQSSLSISEGPESSDDPLRPGVPVHMREAMDTGEVPSGQAVVV